MIKGGRQVISVINTIACSVEWPFRKSNWYLDKILCLARYHKQLWLGEFSTVMQTLRTSRICITKGGRKLATHSSVTGDVKKLCRGVCFINLHGTSLLFGRVFARLWQTLAKYWLKCSVISDGLGNSLLFLTILTEELCFPLNWGVQRSYS